MRCNACGALNTVRPNTGVCSNCSWPQTPSQLHVSDDHLYCEVRVKRTYEKRLKSLIPHVSYWILLAVGRTETATYVAARTDPFRVHGFVIGEDEFNIVNVQGAERLLSHHSASLLSDLAAELSSAGWIKSNQRPQWYRMRFHRPKPTPRSLSQELASFCLAVGTASNEAHLGMQLMARTNSSLTIDDRI